MLKQIEIVAVRGHLYAVLPMMFCRNGIPVISVVVELWESPLLEGHVASKMAQFPPIQQTIKQQLSEGKDPRLLDVTLMAMACAKGSDHARRWLKEYRNSRREPIEIQVTVSRE